jgi:xylulokinase
MADIVGIPMHRQANPRSHNVLGMGLLAFSRLGKLDLAEVPGMIKFDRIFEPDPKNRAAYDHMYAQFSAAREKIRPVMHALNNGHPS